MMCLHDCTIAEILELARNQTKASLLIRLPSLAKIQDGVFMGPSCQHTSTDRLPSIGEGTVILHQLTVSYESPYLFGIFFYIGTDSLWHN